MYRSMDVLRCTTHTIRIDCLQAWHPPEHREFQKPVPYAQRWQMYGNINEGWGKGYGNINDGWGGGGWGGCWGGGGKVRISLMEG